MCDGSHHLWTCPENNNSSIAALKDGKPVVVEQGPKWLVELAYAGPEWLPVLMNVIMLVLISVVILVIYRRGVSPKKAMGVAQNGLLVLGVLFMSYLSRDALALSYVGDVIVGGGGGFIVSTLAFQLVRERIRAQIEQVV